MKSQAKNHGIDWRVPSTVTAPTGAMRPQRLTPDAFTKLPIDHCIANGVKNYFLFLPRPYVAAGAVLTLVLRGLPVSKAEFDPAAPQGVKA